MELQVAARFISLVQTWREGHKLGGKALRRLKSFIESIQKPSREKAPNILEELLEEVPTEELQKYVHRGCKPAVYETGWNTAETVDISFRELHRAKDKCREVLKVLEGLVDEVATDYKKGAKDTAATGNLEDIVYSMVVLIEAIQKEMDVMGRVTEAVQIDTNPSDLRTYCLVWDLQPYLDLNLVEHLSGLIKTGPIE